ncbi:hypothetical protein PPACK8108_LOCUS24483 [Phakopsora pachyrhizi]|uniref:Uncharacterized protein n=1 Tax=Phakopsora pachyrhizi TaxID=170000 RepID=A0AAV0BQN5_PHAPC|nr:hypothetical protein PPACK8108_LOCUS24483 [Phakopsora pachyrhizi]
MTLSGLPPKYSNQEYNTIFVATSNIASALELCAPVVEELNTLSSTGFLAYDSSLNEYVLVMPVVLLFLGDSPMHAEISSTMHPNVSLQPCRICCLKAEGKKEKATANYVQRFIGHNSKGFQVKPVLRTWIMTKKNVYYTWEMFQRGAPKHIIQRSVTEFGVKDVLNQAIINIVKENQDTKLIFNIKKIQEESITKISNPLFELKGTLFNFIIFCLQRIFTLFLKL